MKFFFNKSLSKKHVNFLTLRNEKIDNGEMTMDFKKNMDISVLRKLVIRDLGKYSVG